MIARLARVPWDALRADVALPAIERVLAGEPAERELDRALRAHRALVREERTAVVEAVFGVALWRRRLAWHAGIDLLQGAPVPHPRAILSSGSDIPAILLTCLLRDLAGLPESRAVALTGATRAPAHDEPRGRADRWSLPDWLDAHIARELGDDADAFCEAISAPGPVCLRANRLLCTRDGLARRLAGEGVQTRPTDRAPDGLTVETPQPNLFGTQVWREGWFEPQDEGSQLCGELVQAGKGDVVLDLCAGAGGKTLQLAASGATVFAYDIDAAKLERLRARAGRARASRVEVVAKPGSADRVLVDAPCSELGTLRRGPDARWRISETALTLHLAVQRELLAQAAPLVRKRLVYVTCTLNRAENEDIAAEFEKAHIEFRRDATLKLTPHQHGTDGFFAVAWDRT